MTADVVELLRNLYGASGGAVPGPAWTATLATLLWMSAYGVGLAAGQHAARHSGDAELVDETFKGAFAESLGWTREQFEEFWNNPRYDFGPDDARRFDETCDAWEWMLKHKN